MSGSIRFILKRNPAQRIDVSPITPDALQGMSLDMIRRIPLHVGSSIEPADTLFDIRGDDTWSIRFENPLGKLDRIGQGMLQGLIEVEGDAGSYLGMQMRGGIINVKGSVDAFTACEMKEGRIFIDGDAGDFLGAALPGNKKGIRGGFVQVLGNAGDRVGDRMRRGVIHIKGYAGDYLGSRMTAGTVLVEGDVGSYLGFGMNRGTIMLCRDPEFILPTFSECGSHCIGFIPLFFRYLGECEGELSPDLPEIFSRVRRYAGDLSVAGQGEILVALSKD